jgi:CHAT domain-containing protein
LGLVYGTLGLYPKAIEYHEESLAIGRAIKSQNWEADSLIELGNAYGQIGDDQKANEYAEQALVIASKIDEPIYKATILQQVGNAYYAFGDVPKAIKYQEQGLMVARQNKSTYSEVLLLESLGQFYASTKNYQKAIEYQEKSVAVAQIFNSKQITAKMMYGLGRTYIAMGDKAIASQRLEQSLGLILSIDDRTGQGLMLEQLGLDLLKLNRLQASQSAMFAAMDAYESIRSGLVDRTQVTLAETQGNSYQVLQKILIRQNRSEAALEIAERGRGRAFAELLASRLTNQSIAETRKIAQAPNLEEIRRIAKAQNATLVEYSLNDEFIYIWVVKPNGSIGFKSVSLKNAPASIHKLVVQSRATIGVRSRGTPPTPKNQPEDPTKNLQALYQLLIAPIGADLPSNPDDRIIFIPQGALFLVPFPALQDAKGKYLIEQHTISTAPSIQTLALTQAQRQQAQRQQAQRQVANDSNQAVIVGNPTMPIFNQQQLDPLPGSEKEAIAIGQVLNTKPLIGARANKAAVLKQAQNAAIIHFATHGLIDPVQGDIPGSIALAPTANDNGFLSSNELFDLKLKAHLVVLSACDTGRGEITGDGVIGLSRSMIAAGVPSVVVSLWAIDDQSTAVLMSEFYRNLKTHPNKAKALRQAMLTTMKQYPQPIDWAAFTLVGED